MEQIKEQEQSWQDSLKQKIDSSRESLKSDDGIDNAKVEAEFIQRRSVSQREADKG